MNKVFRLSSVVLIALTLAACGSKKSPTGGPVDVERPVVTASLPEAYGDISNKQIEITFSKALDKNTIASSIYIYPPIRSKKISYDNKTITIRLNDDLLVNTNYYLTLSTRLKDTRGNALEKNQTIVYRNGALNENKISGSIIYELAEDVGHPVLLNLLSADSLMIMSTQMEGNTFSLEGLNQIEHIIRAYIDKDKNGRYDFAKEPYFEGKTEVSKFVNLDVNLAYRDTTLAQIRSVRSLSAREIEVSFSEDVDSYCELAVFRVRDNEPLSIRIKNLAKSKLSLITAEQDTSRYQLIIEKIRDPKGNETSRAGMQFNGSTRQDTLSLKILSSSPRNGTSVNSLQPVLSVTFSKIIPRENISYKLLLSDSKDRIKLDLLSGDGSTYTFKPSIPLRNYRSYILVISKDTKDVFGNTLEKDFELSFLPLFRE
jgi:hypothetical protein